MTDKNQRPYILITNDDGIDAKGIQCLIEILSPLSDLLVVAPDGPRSGQSNAITVTQLIYIEKKIDTPGIQKYSLTGTPTDCVKIAFFELLKHRRPDLIVSGINHGSNAGVSVVYSGTMGAAIEGCLQGIPSIGFSLCSHEANADFSPCTPIVTYICNEVLQNGLPTGICLNVNIPANMPVKGMRVCRQAQGRWSEEYIPMLDEKGNKGYRLTGYFNNFELDAHDTDEWLLARGFATIVPNTVDLSALAEIPTLAARFSVRENT